MTPQRSTPLYASLALHGVLVVLVFLLARRAPPAVGATHAEVVTVEIPSPPPEPVVTPTPPRVPQLGAASARRPSTVGARSAPVARSIQSPTLLTAPSAPEALPAVIETPTPTSVPPTPGPAQHPLTAANLFRSADSLAVSQASLLPPGHVDHGPRNIYGGSPTGTLQEIAAGPTLALLAETQHTLPPGAGVHDRTLASRAAEEFLPTRTVANIGDAVRHAPMVSLAPISRDDERDRSVMGAADAAHASSFTSVAFGGGNTRSYHLVRADVEIDQTPTGAVCNARVVRPSGVAAFDAAAIRAIRAAVDEVEPLNPSTGGRRTRWAFEVSDADGTASRLLGNANEGWTTLGDAVQGVRLRMRVRRLASQRL